MPRSPRSSARSLDTRSFPEVGLEILSSRALAEEETVKICEIPGVLLVEWNEESKTVVDTWSSYFIQVPQFREAILNKGLSFAKSNRARAWVVDSSKARGAFPHEVQQLIETEVFKAFASIGIKYFITIKSSSAIANMAMSRVVSQLGPCGILMVEVPDLNTAIAWLKEHPQAR
jgi:hypothetical protein